MYIYKKNFFIYANIKYIFFLPDLYKLTGEVLGQGACASVQTCINIYTEIEYAVKVKHFSYYFNISKTYF